MRKPRRFRCGCTNATIVIEGLLSGLERKTCEPIAREHGGQRKPIQSFVGCSTWDDEAVMGELRRHVKEKLADADAVLVIDGSGFAKKGRESCGVKRQWCGRLGKVENCQVGVPQIQKVFSLLLRHPRPRHTQIARQVSEVPRRNEEARSYSWHRRTGGYPPRRPAAESG